MARPLTLAEMRDRVRRRLGRATAIEAGTGPAGDSGSNDKKFSNALLNDAIEETISDLNIRCGLSGSSTPLSVSVAAQTSNGPLVIDLATSFGPREAQVNEINLVWWNDGSTDFPPLKASNFRTLDLNRRSLYLEPPGTPNSWWVDRYSLFILPAPNKASTIKLMAGMSFIHPASDSDPIGGLPGDLYRVPCDGAAYRICATQPYDKVMQASAAILEKAYERGVMDVKMTLGLLHGADQGGFVIEPYRYRRGAR